jgi:hypothetical protein
MPHKRFQIYSGQYEKSVSVGRIAFTKTAFMSAKKTKPWAIFPLS